MMGSEWREARASGDVVADPRILDLVHLRRYTMDNQALERELLVLFLGQLPSLLEQVVRASTSAEWKFPLHTLKGSARAIGANGIAELAEVLEHLAPNDEVAALIGHLALEAKRFEDAARKLLN